MKQCKKTGYKKLFKFRISTSLLASFLLRLVLVFIFSACGLFMPSDPNYLNKIDKEIAWANAGRLTVTVTYPQEWGSSPQFGAGSRDNVRIYETPRVGYAFTVEFTTSGGFGFIE